MLPLSAVRPWRSFLAGSFAVVTLVAWNSRKAEAYSGGIASSSFPSLNNGCNSCHSGGSAPTVALEASKLSVAPGQALTFTVTVTTTNGASAGFNLRCSAAGTFAVGGPDSSGTKTILNNSTGFLEMTHSSPKTGSGGKVTFTGTWTPTMGTAGAVTCTAWGNSVNGNGGKSGDLAADASLVAQVGCEGAGCLSGDGCCPNDCNALNDSDCPPVCGNGVVEAGETCDPPASCPASCDDGDDCTTDTMTGSMLTCDVHCSHSAVSDCDQTPPSASEEVEVGADTPVVPETPVEEGIAEPAANDAISEAGARDVPQEQPTSPAKGGGGGCTAATRNSPVGSLALLVTVIPLVGLRGVRRFTIRAGVRDPTLIG